MAFGTSAILVASLVHCSDRVTEPTPAAPGVHLALDAANSGVVTAKEVRALAAQRGIGPLEQPHPVRPALVQLGQALMFDPILSGNHDMTCATCHFPTFSTGDARSVTIGVGGTGIGPNRIPPASGFLGRNAPPLFDLGTLKHAFWDGRVEVDAQGHFHTPAGAQLTPEMARVLEFGALSAQPLFPPAAATEMRGASGNELASLPADDYTDIWAGLMRRLGNIPEYRRMFEKAYPGTKFEDMNFAYASNAIAGFIVSKLTFTNAPWDRFLRGQNKALTPAQLAGAQTFLTLKCSICHNGPTLTDDKFHDVAVAQIGPGDANGASGHDDFGRMNATGNSADQYLFRTTPLRNVELTAPYGHDGAYATLRGFIEHYSQSDQALLNYDPTQLEPALQNTVLDNKSDVLAQRDTLLNGVVLTPEIVDKLMAYMSALTDDAARNLSGLIPASVPSGLPVPRP
ncbi:MAG TPA: cytochrome c peroxidase [Gemmatimonadaceae bacterium]|nr:cytochrome c peroxidase [Gemmatimonadaceae bacterium]